MTSHTFIAFALFSLVSAGTPGPNNIMLLYSGVHFGWLRTLPHILGILLGINVLFVSVSLGVGALLTRYPNLALWFKVASLIYLIYLSYRIIMSQGTLNDEQGARKPLSVLEAALFQWINPKNWAVIIAAISLYHQAITASLTIASAIFVFCGLCCASLWAGSGTLLRGILSNSTYLTWFNRVMGVLLIACVLPIMNF